MVVERLPSVWPLGDGGWGEAVIPLNVRQATRNKGLSRTWSEVRSLFHEVRLLELCEVDVALGYRGAACIPRRRHQRVHGHGTGGVAYLQACPRSRGSKMDVKRAKYPGSARQGE